jgi:hypothetical protein
MVIRKAKRGERYLKIGIGGISGSGKTLGALRMAHGICGDWEKICVIDTENNSADLYAHLGGYSVLALSKFSPHDYIEAIQTVQENGFEVCIIDSLSHEWFGPGGVLELMDNLRKTSKSTSSFVGWAEATPIHQKFINSWLQAKMHIIATLRQKDEFVLEQNEKGKYAPKKIGLKNVQREGLDYEFDLLFSIHQNHTCSVEKDRTSLFDGEMGFQLSEDLGKSLKGWSMTNDPVIPSYQMLLENLKPLVEKVTDQELKTKIEATIEANKTNAVMLRTIETRINQILEGVHK